MSVRREEIEARLRTWQKRTDAYDLQPLYEDLRWLLDEVTRLEKEMEARVILAGVTGAKDGDEIAAIYKAEAEQLREENARLRTVAEAAEKGQEGARKFLYAVVELGRVAKAAYAALDRRGKP